MATEQIIVTVPKDPNEKVTIEVKGIKGSACKGLTAPLIAALGGEATTTATQEMYEKPAENKVTSQLKAKGGF